LDHSPLKPLAQIRLTREAPDLLTGSRISVYHFIQIKVAENGNRKPKRTARID
jgi:hypothetical protein